ncbi:MAG: ABC transporter ATP-binding protein [Thermoanaerobaculia bacterium]
MHAIDAGNLSRSFRGQVAVEALDFEVAAGELFGIVGPDGAGKTTTLRMLAGVLRPTSGDARILGTSVRDNPEEIKRHIAYMPQRFGLYADLTVSENIEFYADLYHVPRVERPARLERLFEFSGLGAFSDRLAGKLSGGMKQKLGLSCALIHQPKVLLLDEPTFGVDPISRRELWVIIHEMVAAGVTAVVSTSYLDEAERFDRLAMIHRGRSLAIATPADLRAGYPGEIAAIRVTRTREARDLVSGLPFVDRALVFGERLHVSIRSYESDSRAIIETLRGSGFEPDEPERIEPGMEDVFIQRILKAEAAA